MSEVERYAYGSAAERRELLSHYVSEQGHCTISELALRFGVSEMTIRRDVIRLAGDGRVRTFHGGVGSLAPSDLSGVDYGDRDLRMGGAKRAIATRALRELSPHAVVAIDAGTTAAQIAADLPAGVGLQVITPSLPVVNTLAERAGVEVTCLGGVLHLESLSFAGGATLAAIANHRVDVLFLAASGLDERGAYCGNSFDAITKRALIEVADKVVLVSDSSKFTASGMVRVCGWDSIDLLITDDGVDPGATALVAAAGVALEVVAAPVAVLS